MRTPLVLLPALAIVSLTPASAAAQRAYDSDDTPGAETCRAIWREFGRYSNGRARAVHCEVRDVGVVPRRETIDVDGDQHTGVHITGAERNDIRVRLIVQAQGDDTADARRLASEVRMDLTRSVWTVDAPRLDDEGRRRYRRHAAGVIVIDAPVETNLNARTTHAPLTIENLRGRLDVTGRHGPVTMREIGGEVRARVAHGPLTIDLSGRQWQGAGLDAEAQHGPLTIRMPRDYGAELELGAEHGPFDIDFPVTVTRFERSRISTKIGAGGPRIRAFAEHGPLSVRTNR
jgi:hypothetical protein